MGIEAKIQKNVKLAPYTTFKIGGPAKFFVEIKFAEDLKEALAWAKKNEVKIFSLGGGSNLLISDKGFDGLVMNFANKGITNLNPRFHCGAGASLSGAVNLSRSSNLSGLEWAIGIPKATIGGSIRGNAGAFGQNIGEIVETVEAFNIKKNRFEFFSRNDCQFGYRTSKFKTDPNFLIWGATFKMRPDSREEINKRIEENMRSRDDRQPKLPSAGSVFKNLFLDDIRQINEKIALHIVEEKKSKGGKVGAGFVIEFCGLKGKKVGGAKISLEHANFIVNTGRATAKDVLDLIEKIKKEVKKMYGIELEEEVQILS